MNNLQKKFLQAAGVGFLCVVGFCLAVWALGEAIDSEYEFQDKVIEEHKNR